MEQKQLGKEERETYQLTEKLYIYKNDPFKILFKNKRKDFALTWVQFLNRNDLPIDYSSDEQMKIIALKELYKKYDANARDGQIGLAKELPKLFPQIVTFIPDDIDEAAGMEKPATPPDENENDEQKPPQEQSESKVEAAEPEVVGRTAPFDEETTTAIDKAEDELIIKQMQGVLSTNPDNFFYELDIGGRKVIGVNVYGANELIRFLGEKRSMRRQPGYEVIKVMRGETETMVWSETYVRDKLADITLPAYVEQSKVMALRNGQIKDDPHARGKADSKSLRNALLKFIPTKDLIEYYKNWKKTQKR